MSESGDRRRRGCTRSWDVCSTPSVGEPPMSACAKCGRCGSKVDLRSRLSCTWSRRHRAVIHALFSQAAGPVISGPPPRRVGCTGLAANSRRPSGACALSGDGVESRRCPVCPYVRLLAARLSRSRRRGQQRESERKCKRHYLAHRSRLCFGRHHRGFFGDDCLGHRRLAPTFSAAGDVAIAAGPASGRPLVVVVVSHPRQGIKR